MKIINTKVIKLLSIISWMLIVMFKLLLLLLPVIITYIESNLLYLLSYFIWLPICLIIIVGLSPVLIYLKEIWQKEENILRKGY